MLAAFQGFTVPHGGKKTRQDVQVIYGRLLIAQTEFNSAIRRNLACNTARHNDNTLSAGSLRYAFGELLFVKEEVERQCIRCIIDFLKHYVSFIMFLLTLWESYCMLLISYSRSLGQKYECLDFEREFCWARRIFAVIIALFQGNSTKHSGILAKRQAFGTFVPSSYYGGVEQ